VAEQEWLADRYATNARFVADLGAPAVELLAPRAGERVLDLGCGDGALTQKLRDIGCRVIGVDAAPDMVREACARGLDARLADGAELPFHGEFDAVFSNAALHWMKRDPDAVIAGVRRALGPGGRFVAEMGGIGNVAAIRAALHAALLRRGHDPLSVDPWFFPSPEAYRARLEQHGFIVTDMVLLPRPTPLPTSLDGWLETFAEPFFKALPGSERFLALAQTIELLRPILCDERGAWRADYVRLRFKARLPV
jgi:SAM-dependent methyltransferase